MKHTRTLLPPPGVTQNFPVGLSLLLLVWLMSPFPVAQAAETLINFDDVADGTLINTHYAGVTFTNPVGGYLRLHGSGFAPSLPVKLGVSAVSPTSSGAGKGAPINQQGIDSAEPDRCENCFGAHSPQSPPCRPN